jgi:cellulose synthase/poly-beta-1,6-N-acetylglucosamine synthase-like glycosyltransferase
LDSLGNMRLSYGITVKDELVELDRLLNMLYLNKRDEDEIVIIYDSNNGSEKVEEYLRTRNVSQSPFRWYPYKFEGHFADLKNFLTKQCSGDYIVQLDADEVPHKSLIVNLPSLLESNNQVDVFLVPRVNTVDGITEEHIKKWGWPISKMDNQINEKEMDTDSDEYKLLKNMGYIIEETIIG